MTEKEKMFAGYLYDPTGAEFSDERNACKDLCYEYNNIKPSCLQERKRVMKKILGKCTDNFFIEQPFYCDYGCNITVGDNFYANHGTVILDAVSVTFGDNVFIAPQCGFYAAGHAFDAESRNKGLEIALPIRVGNNVWIGGGVVVLPGVTIGDNTIIGAGSVVNKDIPSGVVAAGNPCRVIRKITAQDKDKYPRAQE